MIPLMSVTRNFFLGREPKKSVGPLRRFDFATANRITMEEMARMGIRLREPTQAVGTLSGGERQSVAIARAVDAVEYIVAEGTVAAMNRFNSAPPAPSPE